MAIGREVITRGEFVKVTPQMATLHFILAEAQNALQYQRYRGNKVSDILSSVILFCTFWWFFIMTWIDYDMVNIVFDILANMILVSNTDVETSSQDKTQVDIKDPLMSPR